MAGQAGAISITSPNLAAVIADIDVTRRAIGTQDRKAYREVSTVFTGWAQGAARSGRPQERHFASALAPSSTQTSARVLIRGAKGTDNAGALGTFFGSKQYPQFPGWVGKTWTPGVAGQGPYVLNDTAARHMADLKVLFEAARLSAFAHLFPNGGAL